MIDRVIRLSNLDKKDIIIEEIEVKNVLDDISVFDKVYQKARMLLTDIVTVNEAINNNKEKTRTEVENIISFEGRRGTGKTSAMFSIQNALKNFEEQEFFTSPVNSYKKINFHVLEAIDASMLEEGEQILELVLANMFMNLRGKEKKERNGRSPYEVQELYQLFAEIFESLMNMHRGKSQRYYEDRSPLQALTQLSNSQILLKRMKNLVKKYLEYMTSSNESSFLVITIDDLDMHFRENGYNSYDLLETVHRYLMVPGVIVLASYNYLDLCFACEKHFRELYDQKRDRYCSNQVFESKDIIEKRIREATKDYLKKVCPIHTRIHMPSLKKKDYQENTKVLVKSEEINKYLDNFKEILSDDSNKEIKLTLKKFVFLLKASLAGIYYDAAGAKKHFMEVDTLRSLAQTYYFHKQLKEVVNKDDKDKKDGIKVVFEELLNDLYFRFACEKLEHVEYERFKEFLDVSIDRRSRDIVDDIEKLKREEKVSEIRYVGTGNDKSYSYGELLYFLYIASSKGYYTKNFICCILDSYTLMLTRFYHLKWNEEKKCFEYKDEIKKIIGESIAGSWSNLYIPALKISDFNPASKREVDFVLEGQKREEEKSKIKVGAVKANLVAGEWEYSLSNIYSKNDDRANLEMLVEEFNRIEILCMFFADVKYTGGSQAVTGFKIEYEEGEICCKEPECSIGNEEKEGPRLIFKFSAACFNIMNFVKNLFLWEEYFGQLHTALSNAYEKHIESLRKSGVITNEVKENQSIDEWLKENSLENQGKEWYESTRGFAMPLYSFDMMYNLFKRKYKNQEPIPTAVKEEKFLNYVLQVYIKFGELLEKEDAFYFSDGQGEIVKYKFYKNYIESPFIKYMQKLVEDETEKGKFDENFRKMIKTIALLS